MQFKLAAVVAVLASVAAAQETVTVYACTTSGVAKPTVSSYKPTGTGAPVPTVSPPAFTGAASSLNGPALGLIAAGGLALLL